MELLIGKGEGYKRNAKGFYNSETDTKIEIEIFKIAPNADNKEGKIFALKYRGEECGRWIKFDHLFDALERKFGREYSVVDFEWHWYSDEI